MASSVNKVWLRKRNEITRVILKEQIALKGFRSFQISLQMNGIITNKEWPLGFIKQVPRGPQCF